MNNAGHSCFLWPVFFCAVIRYAIHMNGISGPESIKFRIVLQREFMLRDLNYEHDKNKELAWVDQNAELFSEYFEQANENDALLRKYTRASETEKAILIGEWRDEMRKYQKKAA